MFSAETMLTIDADPKHLGAKIGITSVLHNWGLAYALPPLQHDRALLCHLAFLARRQALVSCRPGFFLPYRVLSACSGDCSWESQSPHHAFVAASVFSATIFLSPIPSFAPSWPRCARPEWVVYAKRPFGGPDAVAGPILSAL